MLALACSFGLFGLVVGGCDDRNSVRVYQAPKETAAAPQMPVPAMPASNSPAAPAGAPAAANAGGPQWLAPEGWTQLPAQSMRYATFRVDANDPSLNVIVYTFGPESGAVLPNVNRWEQQIGATPTAAADLAKVVTHLHSNGLEIESVDIKGPPAAGQTEGTRMLAAIIPAQGQMWFLKFVGPATKVEAHKAEYDAFMKSLSFSGATAAAPPAVLPATPDMPAMPAMPAGHPPMPAAGGAGPAPAAPRAGAASIPAFKAFTTPQGWTLDPQERPMRVATFHTAAADGLTADLIISALPANQFGTPEANINRWRGQVGLAPVADPTTIKPTDITVGGAKGFMIDFVGPEANGQPAPELVVAQVTQGSSTYFFKLVGPAKLVETQKKALDSLLQSIQFAE